MVEIPESVEAVRKLLYAFNEGYAKRDLNSLEDFMNIFTQNDHLEFIGIGGVLPGRGAWCLGKEAVQKLIRSDWDYWGQIVIDAENARIDVHNNIAWVSTAATLSTFDETEEFLGDKVEVVGKIHPVSPGDTRVKPLRMTAVLVKLEDQWQFQQIHFSYSVRSLPRQNS